MNHIKNNHVIRSFRINLHRKGSHLLALLLFVTLVASTMFSSVAAHAPMQRQLVASAQLAAAGGSIFGVEVTPIYVNGVKTGGLDEMSATQTAWVRGPDVVWSEIESSQGSYNWTAMQEAVDEIQAIFDAGFEPVVIVRGTPDWAQKHAGYSCGPIAQANFDDFANFMDALITQLHVFIGLDVKNWEIWNEPDIAYTSADPDNWWGGCWGEPGEAQYGGDYYSQMLSVVYPRIKETDPQAQVLVGGLLLDCDPANPPKGKICDSARFLDGLLDDGGGANFDGLSFHAIDYYGGNLGSYSNPNWFSGSQAGGPALIAKSAYITAKFNAYGVTGKYLLNTENTLVCDLCVNDPVFEDTKAYYLAQAYAGAISKNLQANIWFDVLGTWERNNGLFTLDLTSLPAFSAYEFAAGELGGVSFMRKVNEFPGVSGYEFRASNRHVWLLWSEDGIDHTVYFPVVPLNIFDVFGASQPVTTHVEVGLAPQYIETSSSLPRNFLPLADRNYATFKNGGFEQGGRGWAFINSGLPASLITTHPRNPIIGGLDLNIPNGTTSALLGSPNYKCASDGLPYPAYGAVEQTYEVPYVPAGWQVRMSFDYIMYTEDQSTSGIYDRFEVYVVWPGGKNLLYSDGNHMNPIGCNIWYRVPSSANPRGGKIDGWATGVVDLTAYQGQRITISFQNHSRYDGFFNTYTFLDNVNVELIP